MDVTGVEPEDRTTQAALSLIFDEVAEFARGSLLDESAGPVERLAAVTEVGCRFGAPAFPEASPVPADRLRLCRAPPATRPLRSDVSPRRRIVTPYALSDRCDTAPVGRRATVGFYVKCMICVCIWCRWAPTRGRRQN